MITKWFLDAVYLLITSVLGVIPNIPAMDANIVTALSYASTMITNSVGFLKYIYSAGLFNAFVGVGVVLINFDILWDTAFFIIRKIPMIGVKE